MKGVKAEHGSKTIRLHIGFFTDQIADEKGMVVPKNAWDSGMVYPVANPAHGIKPTETFPFNSWDELPGAIERAIKTAGVTLHKSRTEKAG